MLVSDVNEIYSLYSPYSSYQYCGGAPTQESGGLVLAGCCVCMAQPSIIPKGQCACISSNHFFHQWLLLSCLCLDCTQTDSAKMVFEPLRTYPKFHAHYQKSRQLGSWRNMGFCRWEQWDTRMLRQLDQVSWLGEFLWLSVTPVSKCDYIF